MSREQGPRLAGMRPAANAGSARRANLGISDITKEGARMRHDIHDLLTSAIKEGAV